MSDIPAETTNRLADYLIARYGIEEAMPLVRFAFARTEFGDGEYGKPLLPFDERNTLMDALEEATDLSQYIMKKIMENEVIADLITEAAAVIDSHVASKGDFVAELRDMARLLRADCERSVPVEPLP